MGVVCLLKWTNIFVSISINKEQWRKLCSHSWFLIRKFLVWSLSLFLDMMDEGNKRKLSKIVEEINLFISNFLPFSFHFLFLSKDPNITKKKLRK